MAAIGRPYPSTKSLIVAQRAVCNLGRQAAVLLLLLTLNKYLRVRPSAIPIDDLELTWQVWMCPDARVDTLGCGALSQTRDCVNMATLIITAKLYTVAM